MRELCDATANFIIPLPPEIINDVYSSLKPEIDVMHFRRSSVKLDLSNNKLILNFKAKDIPALRAVLNSVLSWIRMTLEIYEKLLELESKQKILKCSHS